MLGAGRLFNYADPLSSINVHYYKEGQELGWHFDNSAFAVTLMIQPSGQGGDFEYIAALRDCDAGDMNFEGVGQALDGAITGNRLTIDAGTLALFRGKNSLHRVTPVIGDCESYSGSARLQYGARRGVIGTSQKNILRQDKLIFCRLEFGHILFSHFEFAQLEFSRLEFSQNLKFI